MAFKSFFSLFFNLCVYQHGFMNFYFFNLSWSVSFVILLEGQDTSNLTSRRWVPLATGFSLLLRSAHWSLSISLPLGTARYSRLTERFSCPTPTPVHLAKNVRCFQKKSENSVENPRIACCCCSMGVFSRVEMFLLPGSFGVRSLK